jgi:hypothetical protein
MARAGGGCRRPLSCFAVLLQLLTTASCQRQTRGTNSERRGLSWRRKRLSECGAGGAGRHCSIIEQRDPSPREARGCIRQHTSAYVSIRQHTSAYVSIRQHTLAYVSIRQHTSAYASIRQHTSYVSIRLRDPSPRETHGCIREHPSEYTYIHTSAFVSIHQHSSACSLLELLVYEALCY